MVKVGDLGLVWPSYHQTHVQPFAMRAPEVFLGSPCHGPSQVWAIAAMVLVWANPNVLGASDSPHFILNPAWSMAKIKRLCPDWQLPHPDQVTSHALKAALKASERMSREEAPLLAIGPLPEETEKMEMPRLLRDLLHSMFVLDPKARPSASDVLASDEFQALMKSMDT